MERPGLPRKNGQETRYFTMMINLVDVLTSTSSYFTYHGSLPAALQRECNLGRAAEPAKLSQTQYQSFRRILGNDFRPLQELNRRTVRATYGLVPHKHDTND